MISVTEAARELGVTLNTVYARITDGTLDTVTNPALKSRRHRLYKDQVIALKEGRRLPTPTPKTPPPPHPEK